MNRVICALLALAAFTLTGCTFGPQVQEQFHKTVPTTSAPHVKVSNVVGEVRVEGWSNNTVDVDATKTAESEDALKSIAIDVRAQGDDVTIETNYTGLMKRGGVRYLIHVPSAASADVDNTTGAIRIEGIDGDVTAKTQTGEIVARVGKVAGGRSVSLSATTGAVTLDMTGDSSATVTASTTVGNVSSDFPALGSSRENVVGASASGTIGSGAGKVTLDTVTGAIEINRQ